MIHVCSFHDDESEMNVHLPLYAQEGGHSKDTYATMT